MKEYTQEAKAFYNSKLWNDCKEGYKRKQRYICERCGNTSKVMIVHHKVYLNETNLNDISVLTNYDNLELLCIECHNKEHHKKRQRRYSLNNEGKVIL